jgi:putative tricarboxylic transport membrane protein
MRGLACCRRSDKTVEVGICTLAALAMGLVLSTSAYGFEPNRGVTIVVTTSAGGGNDVISRTLATVIKELNLTTANFTVENRVGGSGVVGYQHVAQRKGDPYIWANFAAAFFTTPLLGQSPIGHKDFTPLALVAEEPYIMAVSAKSPIKSLDDIRKAGSMLSGTEGIMAGPALIAHQLKDKLKIEVDVVPFGGQSEVIAALLGNHIQVMFGVPTVVIPMIEGNQLRPLAVSAAKRMAALPSVPTFTEMGIDLILTQPRGFVLPLGVSEDARKYWSDVIKKAVGSDNWRKQYLEKYKADAVFIEGEDLKKEFQNISEKYKTLMERIDKK